MPAWSLPDPRSHGLYDRPSSLDQQGSGRQDCFEREEQSQSSKIQLGDCVVQLHFGREGRCTVKKDSSCHTTRAGTRSRQHV